MKNYLTLLDRILRGEATSPEAIKNGSIDIPLRGLSVVIVALAMSWNHLLINRQDETAAEVVATQVVQADDATEDQVATEAITQGPPQATPFEATPIGALERVKERVLNQHVRLVFRIWIVVFCLVGAQMGWMLWAWIGSTRWSVFRWIGCCAHLSAPQR